MAFRLSLLALLLLLSSCRSPQPGSQTSGLIKANSKEYVNPLWKQPQAIALYKLAVIRDELMAKNLFNSYSFIPNLFDCEAPASEFRTADGSCYSEQYPFAGAAGTRLGRNFPLSESKPSLGRQDDAQPGVISSKLLARKNFIAAGNLNLLAAAWIQFMIHDWVQHEKSETKQSTVALEKGHRLGSSFSIPETPNDSRQGESHFSSVNKVTAWWDGSQIYGSDLLTQRSLRQLDGGRLKITDSKLLPVDSNTGQEIAGMTDNWWLGLSLFHHVFVLEHNRIADFLAKSYPDKKR